jgi:hypothetical protein
MTLRLPAPRHLDWISTILLALATVATAWAAYQSRQWTGEQSTGYSQGTAARITENRAAALANRQVQIDVATFIQWLDARSRHETKLAGFYRTRFRPEFQPAFAAWLAARPFTNRRAPLTPFALPRYKLAAQARADALERTAAAAANRAKAANEHADNYMLAVVLFAISLFFAGIATKLASVGARTALLGVGCVLFLATLAWVATLPVHLTA